jgi:outer membrane receptor protein involved in Fe transport
LGRLDLGATYQDVAGTASVVAHLTPRLNLVANATRGFRAPNLDDLSVLDERAEGTEIPNPGVSPEHSLVFEAGVKYLDARLEGAAFVYHGDLRDLLVRSAGRAGGLSFFDLNQNGIQDQGEPNVLQKQNLGRVDISGIEVDLHYQATPGLRGFGHLTYTVGDDLVSGAPLPRIPPTFGALGARWSRARSHRPWLELVFKFATPQRRLSPLDIADSRVGPNGTDGFGVFDLRGGVSAGARFRATLALENLLDRRYKYHGSGVFRPGFQVVVGAEYRFW